MCKNQVMSPAVLTKQKVEKQHAAVRGGCSVLLSDFILDKNLTENDSNDDAKLVWLRSQIIGGLGEIHTPFGIRKLTYADHTASGRCLHYVEDYIIKNVLPFYGKVTSVTI